MESDPVDAIMSARRTPAHDVVRKLLLDFISDLIPLTPLPVCRFTEAKIDISQNFLWSPMHTLRGLKKVTWSAAVWAVRFYERHGFQQVEATEKDRLLRRDWVIPERQIETSVVLADETWRKQRVCNA